MEPETIENLHIKSDGLTSVKTITRWDDLDIKVELLRGIYGYGFETPSDIQKVAIPAILTGKDVIGQAQSGCGKTATFTIGLLEKIDVTINKTQAMIIAPTHELVKQIASVISAIGCCLPGLNVKTIIGGNSVMDEVAEIQSNVPHVIVGCTGRIYDLMRRNAIKTQHIKLFILDEADEMLSRGFKDQIYDIFQFFNTDIQVCLFSATMPVDMLELTKKFMQSPIEITMKTAELNLECIQQYYIALPHDDAKFEMLKRLFEQITVSQCIIFTNSVKRVIDLYEAMIGEGFSLCCIHSEMASSEREKTMMEFRKGVYRLMISSNITARGIDVQQVGTVVNFDIPKCPHNYLHRIGRSGRWGRKGMAINFITRQDVRYLREIESYYKSEIKELPLTF
jgi:translation initiation factor 4A